MVSGSTTSTLSIAASSGLRNEPCMVRWRSSENLAASASNGSPSWNLTPGRSLMVTVLPSLGDLVRERELRHHAELLVDVEQLVADRREDDAAHIGARERRVEDVRVFGEPDAQRGICAAAVPQPSATNAASAARRMVFMMISPHDRQACSATPWPNCINTGIRAHVRWTGKCRQKTLEAPASGRSRRALPPTGGSSRQRWQASHAAAVARPARAAHAAALDRVAGSGCRVAAGRRVERARHVALQHGAVAPGARARHRDRGRAAPACRGGAGARTAHRSARSRRCGRDT